MPGFFEMDISPIIEWTYDLADRYGTKKAQRIIGCANQHHPGVSCVCGWLDDPPMPMPDVVYAGA